MEQNETAPKEAASLGDLTVSSSAWVPEKLNAELDRVLSEAAAGQLASEATILEDAHKLLHHVLQDN